METIDRNLENKDSKLSEKGQSLETYKNELGLQQLKNEKHEAKEQQKQELNNKMNELKKLEVQEFVGKNCVEPIEGVDRIVPFNELAQLLIKSAEDEDLPEVKKSIEEGNAKDKGIYELPAYKNLIKKGFILPSDVRTYYDSADRKPVYHLGVDYNVKADTEVKSMYDGKVVESGLDGGLGHKVIIEHTMPDGTKFYSLYGHLGSKNLPTVGQLVEKGMKIGEVGEAFTPDNGDWEEHLHFQIMENADSPRGYSKTKGEGNYDVLESFGKG